MERVTMVQKELLRFLIYPLLQVRHMLRDQWRFNSDRTCATAAPPCHWIRGILIGRVTEELLWFLIDPLLQVRHMLRDQRLFNSDGICATAGPPFHWIHGILMGRIAIVQEE